jgi:selenocysteine-specific elongation factor
MAMSKNIIVGTAGHIDHGKSTLVEALTGTHPDRLAEERKRGITIDLGFAFLTVGDVSVGFVDVPGHERFVRNMLAGAGGIDLVLLVVAADESVRPQTREHFDICRLLEIPTGIVAITKVDLVGAETLGIVRREIEEFLHGSFLGNAPIVGVSARTGEGLGQLKNELAHAAELIPGRSASSYLRLPIDCSFVIQGFGTVVTGTLFSGTLRPEQNVELLPTARRLRVRGVHTGGRRVSEALAGQRAAANLADIPVSEVARGMVLTTPDVFRPTTRVDARFFLLPSSRALKSGSQFRLYQDTGEVGAELTLLDREQLVPGENTGAQLRLSRPTFLLPGDRFVVRQFSPAVTLGGGVVLDAFPPRRKQRDVHAT